MALAQCKKPRRTTRRLAIVDWLHGRLRVQAAVLHQRAARAEAAPRDDFLR
jgi:hypothetical protein